MGVLLRRQLVRKGSFPSCGRCAVALASRDTEES